MNYSSVVLKYPHFITLTTHTRALRDGHAVDKGTASTSFFLLWKGETRKEEWIRNYVLLLKWQKGALDGYMKILKSERQDCLKELCYSMNPKWSLWQPTPHQGPALPWWRLVFWPLPSPTLMDACLKYWQREKQVKSCFQVILRYFKEKQIHCTNETGKQQSAPQAKTHFLTVCIFF